jgi:hypothetical protein
VCGPLLNDFNLFMSASQAGLSPLDLRELSKDEIPFIVSVFGRGSKTQQKLTLLAPNQKVKDGLENAVIASSSDRKAD